MTCRWMLLPVLFLTVRAAAQTGPGAEKLLTAEYGGKIVHSKYAFEYNFQHFDVSGKAKKDYGTCESWTLCGVFQITSVRLSPSSVKVRANRIVVGFKGGQPTYHQLRDSASELEIDTDPPHDLQAARHALVKVFVAGNEKFSDFLPYYWARFFNPNTSVPAPVVAGPPLPAKRVRISEGVQAAKVIEQPKPHYPASAKAYRQTGTVSLAATIGEDGRVHDLYIVSPAGFGLDEETIEAVKKWRYQPTLVNGQPVAVDTTIVVNYSLRP